MQKMKLDYDFTPSQHSLVFFKILNVQLPYDPVLCPLGIYPNKMKVYILT